MKKNIKKIDATKVLMEVEVSGEIVANKFNVVYEKISKEAKVKGFRPGKVPRDILEKNFSREAHQEVVNGLVPEVLDQAAKEDNLDVISVLAVKEVSLNNGTLAFKAEIELEPEVKVDNYRGIKVSWEAVKVTDQDVSRYIDAQKEKHAAQTVDDVFAKSLGYPSLDIFRASVKQQLFLQKENQIRSNIEQQIIDTVIKNSSLSLPQSLVNRRLDELLRDARFKLAMQGFNKEQVEAKNSEMRRHLLPTAEQQVRVYLILKKIAEKENLPVDEQLSQRAVEFLLKSADWKVSSLIVT